MRVVTVDALTKKGLTVDDDGATCVPLEGFFQRQTKEDAAAGIKPVASKMIVQKREGGFLYATTDLAAVKQLHGSVGKCKENTAHRN